jgi:hypothetical protein
MNNTIDMPLDIYQFINTMIQNNIINIKKLYKINKELIDNTEIIIKHHYCKNRNYNGNLCLNKCINGSKCCNIHDPIMKQNRKNMNLWRREIKKYHNIDYEPFYESKKIEIEDVTLSYEPNTEEIIIKPSAPLEQDIIDPPDYIQKPDECGKTIINHINDQKDYQEIKSVDNHINKNNYNPIIINQLYKPKDKDELYKRFNNIRNNSLLNSSVIDYIEEYQFTIMNKPIDNYLDEINNTNIKELQLKGVRSHKIINELIAINISSYYKAYNRIPSTNFFYKYANTISNIISKIPK